MGNEALILAIIVLIVTFVFVLPAVTKKRTEGFSSISGIPAYDALAGDRDAYTKLLQKKYNRFSDLQDVTQVNFMGADNDRDIDIASAQLKQALRSVNIDVDGTSKTTLQATPDAPPETLAPENKIVAEAKKCEKLNSRANCANLDDPNFSNCGICVRDRTTMFKPEPGADPWKHGGLLIIPDDKRAAEANHAGRPGPVPYEPTVGSCPPGFFFVDRAQCEKKANQLDCSEAGQNGGFNDGLTREKQAVIPSKCASGPVAGSDVFIYDTKNRRFDVNLRVIAPAATGITKVFVTDKQSGNQIGYGYSDTPGRSFVVTVKNVTEGTEVNILVEQETPYRLSGKSEVFQYAFNPNNTDQGFMYNQTRAGAASICNRIGAKHATRAQVEEAMSQGSQICSCAWSATNNGYVMQTYHKAGYCGGKNQWNACPEDPKDNWNKGFGHSWCFGVKPPPSNNFVSFYGKVEPWFVSIYGDGLPSQANNPNIWSKYGVDYQAPFQRAVVMQWEHTADPKRMAQSFEPSITAVNDLTANIVRADIGTSVVSVKTFRALRRLGTFSSSKVIMNPRPQRGDPMLTNQFWLWGPSAKNATVKFTASIPGTFLLPVYNEDKNIVRRGQLITKKETFDFLQVSPCLKDGQNPGAYSPECLATLFASAGGDLQNGKLPRMGMVDPYGGVVGNGIMDLNKLGDMDNISQYLTNLYKIATTGRDINGMRVGGKNGRERAKKVNEAAQLLFGFDITSPCEDINEDNDGTIYITPRNAPVDSDCLQWLYMNAGTDKSRGNENDARFSYPRRGGISATYISIGDRFSGLLKTEGTPKKREDSPFQTCQPTGTMSPIDQNGKENKQAIAMANSRGSIQDIQNFYQSIFQAANRPPNPGSTDEKSMADHAKATLQCFGTTKATTPKKPEGCGIVARYVTILPTCIFPAWEVWNQCIQLPQVEVFDAQDNEVAKGKRVFANTIWQNGADGSVPQQAVNGKNYPHSHNQGEYHNACSNGPDNEYWMVDLGAPTEISQVKVYLRTDCCQQRFIAMPVQLRGPDMGTIVITKHLGEGEYPDNSDMTYSVRFTAKELKPTYSIENIKPTITATFFSAISFDNVMRIYAGSAMVIGPDLGTNNGFSPQASRESSFTIVPARNGQAGCVSFVSVAFPNFFLRHTGFRVYAHWPEGNELYDNDTSFKIVPALNGDPTMISIQSYNYPDHYICSHRDYPNQVWIQKPFGIKFMWDSQHYSWRVKTALSST